MFSKSTKYYHLPQWQDNDKPTWLTDVNTAFENIDLNLKRVEEMAEHGGVPQEIIDRIVALETSVTNIVAKIGTDVIDTIGTSITNAIVNLKSAIDTATTNISNIATQIGITDISDVGNTITQAIRNLADTGVPQTIIDRIVALETSVTNIVAKIGTDVIDTIGTSITNAIVNLKSAIDTATTNITNLTTKIGTDVIDTIGTSITNAIINLKNLIDTATTNITNLTTQIGITDISDVGNTITQAIRNIADSGGGVPQEIIDRIVALETSVTNIVAKIGTDVIDTVGTSITNAIVNLNNAINTITLTLGNTNISDIGGTITQAIRNLGDSTIPNIIPNTEIATNKKLNGKTVYCKFINIALAKTIGLETAKIQEPEMKIPNLENVLFCQSSITFDIEYILPFVWQSYNRCILGVDYSSDNSGLLLYLSRTSGTSTLNAFKAYIEYTKTTE